MAVNSADSFADTLRAIPLLTSAQQAEMQRDLKPRCLDAKALARQLMQRGWLTSYQVNQLLLGRGPQLMLGPYLLLERLGEGGTGQVFKARHQHMNRIVALKLIRPDLLTDREVVGRFHREIQLVSTLTNPHVVHAYDAGPVGANYFLVMEFVEGTDLARLVKKEGPLSLDRASEYIRQTAVGLQHIHERGLVHRDIKPSNLIVTQAQGGPSQGVVKILDLGLARLQQPVNGEPTRDLTNNSVLLGTLDYLAPEQAMDFHTVDIRADIYSLGCTFYQLLTGQPPFSGGTVAQKLMKHQRADPPPLEAQRREVPAPIAAVIRRMMAKERDERFQMPGEIAEVLAAALTPKGVYLPAVVPPRAMQTLPLPRQMLTATVPVQVIDIRSEPVHHSRLQRVADVLQTSGRLAWRHPRLAAAGAGMFACLVLSLFFLRGSSAAKMPAGGPLPDGSASDGTLTYLSDLAEANFLGAAFGKNGHLGHTGNGNLGGKAETNRIIVKGALARKGLSMLAPSGGAAQVQFRLGKQYQQFKSGVALHDGGWFSGSHVTFVVLGDGRVLWQSKGIRTHGDYPQECTVAVTGVDLLELQVTCTSSNNGVWPVWLDPHVAK
ncbi:hypothetical protein AYO44_16435 [Planctomycetaceae bacterium SCGC AG-212-F19]|nr:hypothetical protein AYO44_16435 [Planctomycetaceae bacterium SCGC AG-212-F19]